MMINSVFRNIFYPIYLTSSINQTKSWRKDQSWYRNGKKNECELYQKNIIKLITGYELTHTKYRINLQSLEIKEIKNPLFLNDGFDWSENFDGMLTKETDYFFFNLKFVCEAGGAQTRTLRETYHFIDAQLRYSSQAESKYIFINILEGDTAFQHQNKFQYLLSKYADIDNVFIGDMKQFYIFWSNKYPMIV